MAICHFGIESLVTLFHYHNRRNNAPSLYLTVSEDFEERLDRMHELNRDGMSLKLTIYLNEHLPLVINCLFLKIHTFSMPLGCL